MVEGRMVGKVRESENGDLEMEAGRGLRGFGEGGGEEASSEERRVSASKVFISDESGCSCLLGGICSQFLVRRKDRHILTRPRKAYTPNMTRYARLGVQPFRRCSSSTNQPQMMVPVAVPAVPIRPYQAKMSLRFADGSS